METVGRYQFLRKLGSGGMAEVFLAKRAGAQGIDKLLVVKRVLPAFAQNERFLSMFVDEAKVAMRLNHPNIVQVYAFEEVGDHRLLAMEFVDGTDLARLSSAVHKLRKRLPFALAAYVAQEAAKGLDYAHSRRDERGEPMEIVHRDVSPQNLLLSYDGAIKVTDFGIAKARLVTDEEGVIKGKFAYMSPEQASGTVVDRRSDVWSLGVVLYEMLVGRTLFGQKAGMEALELIKNTDIQHIRTTAPDVPAALGDIVMKALVRDREVRFQSAREMAQALGRFLHDQEELCDAGTLEAFLAAAAPRQAPDRGAVVVPPVAPPAPRISEAEPPHAQIDTNAETLIGTTPVRPPRELRERQNVVIVAGDLRGYDQMAADRGSQAAHAALVEFLRMLGDIAYKSDAMAGPADEGSFILFFGLEQSSVHDPLKAVRVALDVQEALEGLGRDLGGTGPPPLTLGVGVNRGQALCVREPDGRLKRYEPQGAVIPIAEKLAHHARDGQVLVGGGVYRLARRDFNFEEGDQIQVHEDSVPGEVVPTRRGDTAPNAVRAYRFLSAKTREERMREAANEGGGLVGRELELRSLSETYREVVTSGKSSYIALTGEMGIGKTALFTAFLAGIEPPAPRVLRAECTFATLDVPFGCAMDLIRDGCAVAAEDAPEVQREKIAAIVTDLFSDAPPREREETLRAIGLLFDIPLGEPGEAPEASERYRITVAAVRHMLDRLARRGPVMTLIENVQWADRASLDLLRDLAKRNYPLPILGVVVCRPDERLVPFLEGIPRITLSELDREDRKRLIQDRLGTGDDTAELRAAILSKGGGNPFFILEIIESLIDRDILAVDVDAAGKKSLRLRKRGAVALPTTLEGVIAARIDELPADERMALRWAAIAGSVFREKLIADLSGLDVSKELGRLIKRGLLELGKRGELRFRHAVVREVAYGGLDPSDRARMHRKIGERLTLDKSARGAGAARVARHLELAGDTLAAARHYLEAAEAARALYSNREALHFFSKASQLLPPASKDRFLAHERREQILRGLGRRREQLNELEALRKIATAAGDASQMALALNRLGRFYVDVGRSDNAQRAVGAALDVAQRARDKGAEVEALRIMAAVHREQGEYAKGVECCDRALQTLGTGPDVLTQRGTVLIQKGILLRQTGRLRESLQTYAEALVIYRRLGIKRLQAQTLSNMGVASTSMGEYEDAIALYRQSLSLDREIGDRYALGHRLANIGQAYGEIGERSRAMSYLRKSVSVHEAFGDRSGMADALLTISEVLADAGDSKDASETFARALALADTGGDTYDRARARTVGADLEMRAGRIGEARAHAQEGVTIARNAGLRTFEAHALSLLADALRASSDHAGAREAAAAAVQIAIDAGRLERAERVYFVQYRVLSEFGDKIGALMALTRADAEVKAKLERFRTPELREQFRALPWPRRITEALATETAAKAPPPVVTV